MSHPDATIAFVPLNDAAVPIVAAARGFFRAEGLTVALRREVSWATVRDRLQYGAVEGAHLLGAVALASTLGVGSQAKALLAPMALNAGGAALTLASRFARLTGDGPEAAARLAEVVERRRAEGASRLTFAIVFPWSTHNYLLRGWLADAGIAPDDDVRLIVAPPSRMAALLGEGVIEGFCAGEPWNAAASAAGVGRVVMRAAEALPDAPDKVFAIRQDWAGANGALLQALLRALAAAARWCDEPDNREELVSILAEPAHVGAAPGAIAAGLAGMRFSGVRHDPAQALWLLRQMRRWSQLPPGGPLEPAARRVYAAAPPPF
jgi:NitT/TauT family transport system ATP-binding protein/nitrate/nitrite transport system substrate-binding protein